MNLSALTPYVPYLASSIGAPVIGVLTYKWRAKVDVEAKKENADLDAKAAPLQILRDELAKREAEISEMRQADREDRRQTRETLTSINTGMQAMANQLNASAAEARENAKITNERLLVIETQIGIKR